MNYYYNLEPDRLIHCLDLYYHGYIDRTKEEPTTLIIASIYSSVLYSRQEGYDLARRDVEVRSTPRDPILQLIITI